MRAALLRRLQAFVQHMRGHNTTGTRTDAKKVAKKREEKEKMKAFRKKLKSTLL